jgi:hypothetical protein
MQHDEHVWTRHWFLRNEAGRRHDTLQTGAFLVSLGVLFQWCGAHWFCTPDNDWFAFGQNYTFCVLPICVMLICVADLLYSTRPYKPESNFGRTLGE